MRSITRSWRTALLVISAAVAFIVTPAIAFAASAVHASAVVVLQEPTTPSFFSVLLSQLLAVVIPPLAAYAATWFGKFTTLMNSWSPLVVGVVGVLLGAVIGLLEQKLGLVLPHDLAGWNQSIIALVLTAVIHLIPGIPAAATKFGQRRGMVYPPKSK